MQVKKFNFSDLKPSTMQPEAAIKAEASGDKVFEYFGSQIKAEEPEFTKSDIKKAEDAAYKKGYEEASTQMQKTVAQNQNNVEQQILNQCNLLLQKIETANKTLQEKNSKFQEDCILLAGKIAKHIAAEAIKNDPTENIAKLFESSIKEFYSEPEIKITVNTKLLEQLSSRFNKIAIQKNFVGKINFIPDSKIPETDCSIEWGSTGLSIKHEEVIQKIDDIINEYCKSVYNKSE